MKNESLLKILYKDFKHEITFTKEHSNDLGESDSGTYGLHFLQNACGFRSEGKLAWQEELG